MHELTVENIDMYLKSGGWVAPSDNVRAQPLTGGVSNVVFRIETSLQPAFILKQSRPQLRTRDAWFSDVRRAWREQEVIEALAPYLDDERVPRVLFVDRANYAFAMSHAPPGARVWKEQLLESDIDNRMGEHVGRFLATMHQSSAENRDAFQGFSDVTLFDQLRIDPFYRRVAERRPEVATALEPILHDLLTRKEALCHGDYTPKNMLVHERGFMLVDYETAHFGDPAMDLGLCFAHLLLKAARRPEDAARLCDIIQRAWSHYVSIARFQAAAELERRGTAHLGVCLLARVDGTSPVDYLSEPQRERVRGLGRTILLDHLGRWDDILSCMRATPGGD